MCFYVLEARVTGDRDQKYNSKWRHLAVSTDNYLEQIAALLFVCLFTRHINIVPYVTEAIETS